MTVTIGLVGAGRTFAVPPSVQAELAVAAVQRGKAVFLERPTAGDIAGAENLVEAAPRRSVPGTACTCSA